LLPSQYTLNIFGQGKERANLEKLADQLNQRVRVTFFGPVNDPREAFRQMDILVLPSESEGFGIVLLEAAAAGLPIVATQVAGIRDVVTHQQTALLVPPKSPAALKDAIQQACENATLREHLITEASRHVRQHFNWSKAVEAYVKLINA
jgi:glycosyltransferase involved in cell wall biosynthesis